MALPSLSPSPSARAKRAEHITPAVYSMAETARLLAVNYATLNTAVRNGSFPIRPFRVGRSFRFLKSDVDRLLGLDTTERAS